MDYELILNHMQPLKHYLGTFYATPGGGQISIQQMMMKVLFYFMCLSKAKSSTLSFCKQRSATPILQSQFHKSDAKFSYKIHYFDGISKKTKSNFLLTWKLKSCRFFFDFHTQTLCFQLCCLAKIKPFASMRCFR